MNRPRAVEITSAANSLVKVYRRALKDGATREGWLAVEGPHLLEEALAAGSRGMVRGLLVTAEAASKQRGLLTRLPVETELARVSPIIFAQIAQTEAPQGVAALVELPPPALDSLLSSPDALLLVAAGVQDPGNLGTMLRSAFAFGATALLTLRGTVSPFNPKAVRASAGAIFRLPVLTSLEAQVLLPRLREKGVRIVAAERSSRAALHEIDLRGRIALLIGREGSGLDPELLRQADAQVAVPIRPGSDSLNASVAAASFLYEAARQRGFKY
jgi:TrmH family RNA methyltransferase